MEVDTPLKWTVSTLSFCYPDGAPGNPSAKPSPAGDFFTFSWDTYSPVSWAFVPAPICYFTIRYRPSGSSGAYMFSNVSDTSTTSIKVSEGVSLGSTYEVQIATVSQLHPSQGCASTVLGVWSALLSVDIPGLVVLWSNAWKRGSSVR